MKNIDEVIKFLESELRTAQEMIKSFDKSYSENRYLGFYHYGGSAVTAAIKQKCYQELLFLAVDLPKHDDPVEKIIMVIVDKLAHISGYENTMCSSCQFSNLVRLKETEAYASLLLEIRREWR